MDQQVPIRTTVEAVIEESSRPVTLLGIGPVSVAVLQAALESARDLEFPLMFIATRNQIEIKEFGGGYLNGWDQYDFVENTRRLATSIGYTGPMYFCRDHGGPWQRDEELREGEAISLNEAMYKAETSLIHDMLAGFDLLHIDPTKGPESPYSQDVIMDRTVALIDTLEIEAHREDKTIGYEVGTEDIIGGITSVCMFADFVARLTERLRSGGLPKPLFVVGQTGTLLKMNRNVGEFEIENTRTLCKAAAYYDIGFKEHNTDYVMPGLLRLHPFIGITGANVAPEFGHAETTALLELAEAEAQISSLSNSPTSHLKEKMQAEIFKLKKWRKWLTDKDKNLTEEDIRNDEVKLQELTVTCGHYTFSHPNIIEARKILYAKLSRLEPHKTVISTIRAVIEKYVEAFCLEGFNNYLYNIAKQKS